MASVDKSKVIEWSVLIVIIVSMIVGGAAYVKSLTIFQVFMTVLSFVAGGAVGAILAKWYFKYVRHL